MAVIDVLPAVQVEMTVDDVALKEYKDPDLEEKDERTTTQYVEAASGQVFEVRCMVAANFKYEGNCFHIIIYADGTRIDGWFMEKGYGAHKVVSKGYNPGDGAIRKYRFADLDIVSDVNIKSSKRAQSKDLGSIVVECWHQNVSHVRQPVRGGSKSKEEMASVGSISEKLLKGKALTHSIDFTVPVEKTKTKARPTKKNKMEVVNKFENAPGFPDSIATFVFCYRSHAALKSMLIIPRSPSPPPLAARDAGTLSIEEIQELQRRLQAAEDGGEAKVKIKRELDDSDSTSRKRRRPNVGDAQLELDDDGNFRESVVTTAEGTQQVVIELD